MKKIIYFVIALLYTITANTQPLIEFENNYGFSSPSNVSSGAYSNFIDVGDFLIAINSSIGDNFMQTDLLAISKEDGEFVHNLNLSNNYDDYFNIVPSVQLNSEIYIIINEAGFLDEEYYISHLYKYNPSTGFSLLNSYQDKSTKVLTSKNGNLYLLDNNELSVNIIETQNYGVIETIPLVFENTDFTVSNFTELNNSDFLLNGQIGSSNNADIYLAKFDLNGQIFWEQTIGGSAQESIQYVKYFEGDIYMCGLSKSYDGIFADEYGEGIEWGDEPIKSNWIIKLNNNGDILWNKLFGNTEWVNHLGRFNSINFLDNSLIVSGWIDFIWGVHDDYSEFSDTDVFSVKMDFDGNVIWEKNYGGFNDQTPVSVIVMNEKLIYVSNLVRYQFFGIPNGGYFWESFGDVTAETNGKFDNPLVANSEFPNQNDIWIFATDFDGNILWNEFYGGESFDFAYKVINNQEAIYVSSSTQSVGYDVGELIGYQDFWVFKLGDYTANLPEQEKLNIGLYPNPTNNILNVKSQELVDIEIYDSIGKLVLNKNSTKSIDVSKLSNGIYFLNIKSGSKITTKKFIKN
jgi:hypothetical protein